MRGRKPLPTEAKRAKGTLRRDRVNANEPKPDLVLPDPPDFLTAEAIAEWRRMARESGRLGILTRLDRGAFTAYCMAWGDLVRATKALGALVAEDPMSEWVTRAPSGRLAVSPLRREIRQARLDLVKFASEFGGTPTARSRINAENLVKNQEKPADPTDKYFDPTDEFFH